GGGDLESRGTLAQRGKQRRQFAAGVRADFAEGIGGESAGVALFAIREYASEAADRLGGFRPQEAEHLRRGAAKCRRLVLVFEEGKQHVHIVGPESSHLQKRAGRGTLHAIAVIHLAVEEKRGVRCLAAHAALAYLTFG